MTENIKKAIESAEQEIQEKEVAELKKIVKDLLEKKSKKEENKREIEKEISVIKQTIDDFKAGRLDKVKELIEKDSIAKDMLPFKVIIINQTIYNQPWKWNYQIVPICTPMPLLGLGYNCTTSDLVYQGGQTTSAHCGSTMTGSSIGTFTAGSYDVGGRIISL